MSKAVLVIDMPSCCEECFALDFHGDYPRCIISDEQRGYTFNTRTQRMTHCPLKTMPEKYDIEKEMKKPHDRDYDWEFEGGWNACIDSLNGE